MLNQLTQTPSDFRERNWEIRRRAQNFKNISAQFRSQAVRKHAPRIKTN